MAVQAALAAHLKTGITHVCRCWAVTRRDGVSMGFTDHDRDLSFEGLIFRADTGLTARAVQQMTGLAVDNSEALGALSDLSIREEDIEAGRYDGAEVRAWLVNWADLSQRHLQFRGTLGEITRAAGAFQAELRGLSEPLNQPVGRVYQKPCAAVLGDSTCQFDLKTPGFAAELPLLAVVQGKALSFEDPGGFLPRWFERGTLRVLSGAASGLVGVIKNDRLAGDRREIELWQALRAPLVAGDLVRLEAGCDKRVETCRAKFNNFLNYQGFPHIPGEDWLTSYPRSSDRNDGGSLGG